MRLCTSKVLSLPLLQSPKPGRYQCADSMINVLIQLLNKTNKFSIEVFINCRVFGCGSNCDTSTLGMTSQMLRTVIFSYRHIGHSPPGGRYQRRWIVLTTESPLRYEPLVPVSSTSTAVDECTYGSSGFCSF